MKKFGIVEKSLDPCGLPSYNSRRRITAFLPPPSLLFVLAVLRLQRKAIDPVRFIVSPGRQHCVPLLAGACAAQPSLEPFGAVLVEMLLNTLWLKLGVVY